MSLSLCPVLPFAVAFMTGILFNGAVSSPLWVAVPLVLCLACVILRRPYLAVLSIGTALGFTVSEAHRPLLPQCALGGETSFSGVVKESREYSGVRVLVLEADSCRQAPCPPFLAKCVIPSMPPPVDDTDRIRFTASMDPLESRIDLPDETDYNASFRRMGVVAQCFIHPDSIQTHVPEPGPVNSLRRLRRDLQARIALLPISSETCSFLMAALTGDRSWLTPSTRDLFSLTGIAHILALSGLHVGIISAVIMIMLFPLTAVGMRRCSMLISIGALWVFAILTGLSPSVVRAVVMATIFLVTMMMQRVWSPLNALAVAALLLLVFNPSAIYTLGFQLTFLAVLFIIVFARRLNPIGYRYPILRAGTMSLAVSAAAMLGTGIVCAYHFHIFPLCFLVTNIAVSVLLPPLIGGALILLLLSYAGISAPWLGGIVDFMYSSVTDIALWISGLPGAAVTGVWFPSWIIPVYFILALLFAVWLWCRRAVMLYAMGIIAAFTVLWWSIDTYHVSPSPEAYITRSPSETTMLVREGDTLLLYTTARLVRHPEVAERARSKYETYMLRRSISAMVPLSDGAIHGSTSRCGDTIFTSGITILFVGDNTCLSAPVTPVAGQHVHYAVVCRGFTGDICRLAGSVCPDTLLLSADPDPRRHDRYCRELTAASLPHRSLRSSPLILRGCF